MSSNEPRPAITRSLTLAYLASLLVALGVGVASAAGLASDATGVYGDSSLVLVSRGADAANLVLVLPVLLGTMWLARRGSLFGLLLWPGALFYVLYAYFPYLVGAPFSGLFFVHVALVTISAFTVVGILASIDGQEVRRRLAAAPARGIGAALVLSPSRRMPGWQGPPSPRWEIPRARPRHGNWRSPTGHWARRSYSSAACCCGFVCRSAT